MPKLSVIVPAYNVEPYIDRCLQSLLDQTLPDIEIIAVNDGSTDRTRERLEAFRRISPDHIRVLHKENGGSSATARNVGVAHSTADWIGFVDGDDWVGQDMFLQLHAAAENDRPDVVICGGRLVDDSTGADRPFQDVDIWRRLLSEHKEPVLPRATPDLFLVDASVCRRLYSRSFLDGIKFRFADGFLFEDIAANFQILLSARRVTLVDHDGYFYRCGHGGRMTGRRDKGLLDAVEMVDRAATALASADASLDIWANFIYYQSWVLSWLGKQIEPRYAYLFAQRAARLGGRFPAAALRQFKARYRDQTPNLIAVCLQCQQSGFLLWKYTSGHLAPNVRDACLHWGDLASDGPPEELWPKIGDGMEG